jgi:hypothetical protein
MNWKWLSVAALVLTAALLLNFSGCAHDQQLVAITIQPTSFTFLVPDPAGQAQFTAIGTYIHPPASKDITNSVTWKSSTTQVALVSSTGIVSPSGTGCGGSQISASSNRSTGPGGNTVFAFANVTVDDPSTPGCPNSGITATLTVDVLGNGTVTSAPPGITCTNMSCSAPFPQGSTVILTEAPGSGATFAGWGSGCTSQTTNQCTVVLSTNLIISATFN